MLKWMQSSIVPVSMSGHLSHQEVAYAMMEMLKSKEMDTVDAKTEKCYHVGRDGYCLCKDKEKAYMDAVNYCALNINLCNRSLTRKHS